MEAVQSAMGLGIVLQVRDMASSQFGRIRNELTQTRRESDTLMRAFDANMSKMAMGLGMVATGAGLLAATFVNPISMAMQSQYKMAEVNTLLGRNQEALMARLGDQSSELAMKFGKNGADITSSMYGLISAGIDAKKVGGVLDTVGKLATGGMTDMATASDGLTSLMNAFNVAAENSSAVADSMFVAMKRGKTTIGELSSSIGQVAPIAAKAGMSIDDMLGSIATATLSGLGTAESATGLRATLNAILQPSEQAKKMAAELGIAFNEQALKAKGLRGVLEDVMKATKGDADQIGALLGSVEAFGFASNVMKENGGIWSSIMDDMAKKSGAADEAFSIVADTWLFKWNTIKQSFTVGIKRFGAVFLPIMGVILTPIGMLVKAFANLPKPLLGAIGVFVALGATLLISRGLIFAHAAAVRLWSLGVRNNLVASAARGQRALFGLNATFLRSGLIMAGTGIALYMLYKAYENNFGGIKTAVSWVKAAWDVAMSATEDGTAKIKKSVLRGLGFENLEEGAQVIGRIASGFFRLKNFVEEFIEGFKNEFKYVAGVLDEFGEKVLGLGDNAFTDMLKSLLNIDKSELQSWKDWGKTLGMVALYIIAIGGPIWMIVTVFGILSGVVGAVGAVFGFLLSPIGLVVLAIAAVIAIGVALYTYWDGIKAFFVSLWESPTAMILMFLSGPIGLLIAIVTAVIANWDALKAWFVLLWNDPGAAVDQFKQLVMNKLGEACDWAKQKWQGLKEFLAHPIDAVVNFVKGGDSEAAQAGANQLPGHASGGIFSNPHIAWICEDGPEAVQPLDGSSRAKGIWQQTGQILGMFEAPQNEEPAPRPTTTNLLTERFESLRELRTVEKMQSGRPEPAVIENIVYLDGEQVYRAVKRQDRYDRLRGGDDSAE